jgi:hypothetical protein
MLGLLGEATIENRIRNISSKENKVIWLTI